MPQWFEKMISGMYLGEIVRCVLAKFAQEAALFGGPIISPKLLEPFSLGYRFLHLSHQHYIHTADPNENNLVRTI